MRSVVKTSKTVEEATNEALTELNVSMDDVSVEVIDEPNRGFLGFIGSRDAKVRVTVDNDPVEIADNFLRILFNKMKIDTNIKIERKKYDLNINVEGNGKDMGIIIGKRGKTLDSIQYLTSLKVNKGREKYIRIVLDTEGYRQKREETLKRLAFRMAEKVKRIGKSVKLEYMNPYERRIIHSTLQNDPNVTTYSEGKEPYRKVVIELK